jgi:zinc protease
LKLLLMFLLLGNGAAAQLRLVALPGKSPLVTFRIVLTSGSEADPPDKPGLAHLTAMMLANGGTREMTYQQITAAMFPMAASISAQVDQEMCAFGGATHVDNLAEYYKLLRAMLLDPGWREDDFHRVKEDAINAIRVGLRGNNDEELAKEVLLQNIFQGTPYGHYPGGSVSSLEKITLDDVKRFYHAQYSQSNLILGVAGGYPETFPESLKRDFRKLPEGAGFRPRPKPPSLIEATRMVIVDKDTRSVAFSAGFPIAVTRRHPDYAALLLVSSYLGQHRMGGVLYDELREKRGLNYGDYAYIEYFPQGMFLMEPSPNLARRYQIFQLWIRPVEPPTAKFALRLAMYELSDLLKNGMSESDFARTRDFLMKYVNVLTRTKRAELGYAIDSLYYRIPNYNDHLKTALARLTRDDVNRAIRRHLRTDRMVITAVSKNGEELKRILAGDDPSPITYNSPKPDDVTAVDKIVEKWPLRLLPADIAVVPAKDVFQ